MAVLHLFQLAVRNIVVHARRSFITGLSIAVGMAVLLWYGCVIEGRNQSMIRTVTSTYTGHLQIYKQGYLKNRLPSLAFEPSALESYFARRPELVSAKRVHLPAIVSTGDNSVPLLLEGIEPSAEAKITQVRANLRDGDYLDDGEECSAKEIYLSRALADVLNIRIGGKLVVLAQANDGTLGNDLFRVKGLFDSGSPEFDKKLAYAPLACVQTLGAVAGVHEVAVGLDNPHREELIMKEIAAELPAELYLSTWREALPEVARMIRFNAVMMNMITTILFSVIILGVVNTLLIGVFERTKEFGVALALGMTPAQVRCLVVFESFVLGLGAIAVGTLIGGAMVYYHQQTGFDLSVFFGETTGTDGLVFDLVIEPIFKWDIYGRLAAICMLFILAAGVYPAFKASRLNPIEVIR